MNRVQSFSTEYLPYVQKQQQKTLKANAKRFQNKTKSRKGKTFFPFNTTQNEKKKKILMSHSSISEEKKK